MTQAWPAGLPKPTRKGYRKRHGDGRQITNMDQGPPRVRLRYANAPDTYTAQLVLTSAQLQIFDNLWYVIMGGGVDSVNMPLRDSAGTANKEVKILDRGQDELIGIDAFRLSLRVVTV